MLNSLWHASRAELSFRLFVPALGSFALLPGALAQPVVAVDALAQSPSQSPSQSSSQPPSQSSSQSQTKTLGVVSVQSGVPTSLPTQIPTTMEGITGAQIEASINATDSEDALKYLPSLLVRKRYSGDYNHAVLSSRASGTGNSARSAVYADGMLLSNYLGNGVGGLSFPPRWGMVTPEEIERVDVMYGPFSAAYPGNSVGAVVDYVTRMPTQFEGHARLGYTAQKFDLYSTHETYTGWQSSASLGSKSGDWAWWVNMHHTDSQGQPLTFATRLASVGTGAAATPGTSATTGAVPGLNNANQPWLILGAGTAYHTVQDHLKVKLAYDVSRTLRATYTLGYWQNQSTGRPVTYLRDASGQPVTAGGFSAGGLAFTGAQALTGGDFALTNESLTHAMHGLSLKSNNWATHRGAFDWEVAASTYGYLRDHKRQNGAANTLPTALNGGAGTLADGSGTGWNNLALKGTWRDGTAHTVDFGLQRDNYHLGYVTSALPNNWMAQAPGAPGSLVSSVQGRTALTSLYAQDAWAFAPRWKSVLGLRAEAWAASDGLTAFSATTAQGYAARREHHLSPKAALAFQWSPGTVLKASAGRAVRMPTVGELYGATSTTNSQYINDPNLQPEKSWTTELTAEKDLGTGLLRATYFTENTRDALYSQTTFDAVAVKNISRVQNIARIQTQGLELAYSGFDVATRGLDLNASVTYANSVIRENNGFVVVPGDTVGKQQPNIPKWRGSVLAAYRWDAAWNASLGARYSGTQFRTLNNSDVNGNSYQGVSRFFTIDARVRYRFTQQLTGAFGVDNLNNYKFWNFHPYPQRTYVFELKADL
jgi:iron complex outermembrane recepter protein